MFTILVDAHVSVWFSLGETFFFSNWIFCDIFNKKEKIDSDDEDTGNSMWVFRFNQIFFISKAHAEEVVQKFIEFIILIASKRSCLYYTFFNRIIGL